MSSAGIRFCERGSLRVKLRVGYIQTLTALYSILRIGAVIGSGGDTLSSCVEGTLNL